MTLNSSDQLFESLSALVDNEANELEVRRILKNVEHNSDLMERWRRYHLIGSALRKERSVQISGPNRLVESVASYIDSAPSQVQNGGMGIPGRGTGGDWRDLIGKSAVAASFAVTLVLGFNFLGGNSDPIADSVHLTSAATTAGNSPVAATLHIPVGFELPIPEARTVSTASNGAVHSVLPVAQGLSQMDDITDPATQQFLNQLLIQHAERASAHGSLGIMPFARVSRMSSEISR
jgi:sigma-E factor negative regulatory protein RseA